MGIEALGWAARVWDWCGGPRADVNSQGILWMTKDGWRAISGPLYPSLAIHAIP